MSGSTRRRKSTSVEPDGDWRPAVSTLIRWLLAADCHEYAQPLNRQVQSLLAIPPDSLLQAEAMEADALKPIRSWLNHIENEPPQCLKQVQRKELDRLCCQATAQVSHRLRQLASNARADDRATRKIEEMLLAHETTQADAAGPGYAPGKKRRQPTIYGDGKGNYRVGRGECVCVSEDEDTILQAFSECHTMDTAKLKERSGIVTSDASRIVRGLRKKYGGRFAPAIRTPGKKGRGGYHAVVKFPGKPA
jgi:hypothetical protein